MQQRLKDLVSQFRATHWIKNFLILFPCLMQLAFVQQFESVPWVTAFAAFMAFNFSASFGYLVNDVCDVTADRQHPTKKNRPYARGAFSMKAMISMMILALLLAAGFSAFTSLEFVFIVACYLLGTTAYALILKRVIILDVVWVALLMTSRLYAGFVIAGLSSNLSLILFFLFSFVGFTFQKRRINSRYDSAGSAGSSRLPIRRLEICVVTFWMLGLISASYFILIDSPKMGFSNPTLLFASMAIYAAWFIRVKRISSRDGFSKDLIDFCSTDFVSWLCLLLLLVFAWLAI